MVDSGEKVAELPLPEHPQCADKIKDKNLKKFDGTEKFKMEDLMKLDGTEKSNMENLTAPDGPEKLEIANSKNPKMPENFETKDRGNAFEIDLARLSEPIPEICFGEDDEAAKVSHPMPPKHKFSRVTVYHSQSRVWDPGGSICLRAISCGAARARHGAQANSGAARHYCQLECCGGAPTVAVPANRMLILNSSGWATMKTGPGNGPERKQKRKRGRSGTEGDFRRSP